MHENNFKNLCRGVFSELLSQAKRIDEAKFLTSLLAFYKSEEHKIISYIVDYEFTEVQDFIQYFEALQDKENDLRNKTRIRLLIYCHIIEVDFIYMVLYNILKTIQNQDYSAIMNFKSKKGKIVEAKYPSKKIELLEQESQKIGIDLAKIYSQFYFRHVRNAFSHSQYFIGRKGDLVISKHLSPTTSDIYKQPNDPPLFKYD